MAHYDSLRSMTRAFYWFRIFTLWHHTKRAAPRYSLSLSIITVFEPLSRKTLLSLTLLRWALLLEYYTRCTALYIKARLLISLIELGTYTHFSLLIYRFYRFRISFGDALATAYTSRDWRASFRHISPDVAATLCLDFADNALSYHFKYQRINNITTYATPSAATPTILSTRQFL
jgi:hypothetical protein